MQSYDKYILSTGTHYIANSGKDENGTYKNGRAGDQTGHEWELKKWYNRPWSVVLRWPDIQAALLDARMSCAAALNDKVGYDQYQRKSYWTQLEKAGYDPSKITVACEEDCTAGVTANWKGVGYLLGIESLKELGTDTYSGNMKSRFVKAGFKALTAKKYLNSPDYLLPGDVLLYENHHAAANVTYGKYVRPADGKVPEIPDSSVPTVPEAEGLKRGDMGDDVRAMQRLLLKWDPDCLPAYGADGDFGKETEKALKAFQAAAGLTVNGVYDEATRRALAEATAEKPEGTPAETPSGGCGEDGCPIWVEITGGSVNVRSAPGTEGTRVIGTAHRGELLAWQGESRTVDGRAWYLVDYKNQNGWVSGKYARLSE